MTLSAKDNLRFYRLGDQVGFSFLAAGEAEDERLLSPTTTSCEKLVSLLAKHNYADDAHRLRALSARDVLQISDIFLIDFKADLLAALALEHESLVYCDDCKCHH